MAFPNKLKVKESSKDKLWIGMNGRYGLTKKTFGELNENELAEFYLSSDQKTRNQHLTGSLPKGYVNPDFDEAPPAKPTEDKKKKADK